MSPFAPRPAPARHPSRFITRAPRAGCAPGLPGCRGLTLMEVLVTLAIVSIIVAIAYPSYVTQIQKMRRSDAKQSLVRLEQGLQRCYSRYRRFDSDECDLVSAGPTIDETSIDGHYRITSVDSESNQTLGAESFTLYARPEGVQTGDTQCAELRLSNASQASTVDVDGNDTTSLCWR